MAIVFVHNLDESDLNFHTHAHWIDYFKADVHAFENAFKTLRYFFLRTLHMDYCLNLKRPQDQG